MLSDCCAIRTRQQWRHDGEMRDEKSERWKPTLLQSVLGLGPYTDHRGRSVGIPSPEIRKRGRRRLDRNERIMELKSKGASHRTIAKTLDRERYRPPDPWDVKTFQEAYQEPDLRSLFHKMCSTNKPLNLKKQLPFKR